MKHQISHFIVALNASTEAGDVPRDIQLLPAGSFRATDGRPADVPAWVLTRADAERIIAAYANRTNPAVIDFEHQTLLAKTNGQPAPASGWFKTLQWREPSADSPGGLWAINVDWTAAAAQMIASKAYKFISPVFTYDKTGHVQRLLHAALTNDPALDGMAAVAASFDSPHLTEALTMDDIIERLIYLLNIPVTSTPDEIAAQLDKLKAQVMAAPAGTAAASFGGLSEHIAALTQRITEAGEQMAALTASHQPTAVVEELKTQLAVLTAEHNKRQIDDLVKTACADGLLVGAAQIDWARKQTPEALSAYLAATQPIAALTGTQTGGIAPDADAPKLTAEELAACTLLGQNPDDYIAFKSRTQGAK